MRQDIRGIGLDNQRRFVRAPLAGTVRYAYASEPGAVAKACDVSRGGLSVEMGRYLRPGTRLMLEVPGVETDGNAAELKAEIAWCRATNSGHAFRAGIRVIEDQPDVLEVMSNLLHRSLFESGLVGVSAPQQPLINDDMPERRTVCCFLRWVPCHQRRTAKAS